MDNIKDISYFFNLSPIRHQCLEINIQQELPIERHSKRLDVCRTRWVARIDGMNIFENLMPAIVSAFEDMSYNDDKKFNRDTSAKATAQLKLVLDFQFIVSLVLSRNILD